MNTKSLIMTAAVALAAISTVQAIPVTGEVDMSGTVTLNSTSLGTAGSATALSSVTVGGVPTGSFAGTFGSPVTWHAFGWNPVSLPSPVLWTFNALGNTYSFDLTGVSVATQNNAFLNLMGTGTLSVTGETSETGAWSFTISNPGGGAHANFDFTFANSQVAVGVPDGGTTVMLLGAAISGLGLIRRKLAA